MTALELYKVASEECVSTISREVGKSLPDEAVVETEFTKFQVKKQASIDQV